MLGFVFGRLWQPESEVEVAQLLAKACQGMPRGDDMARVRQFCAAEVQVQPLTPKFEPAGELEHAVLCDLSIRSAALLTSRQIPHRYALLELRIADETLRLITTVLRCEQVENGLFDVGTVLLRTVDAAKDDLARSSTWLERWKRAAVRRWWGRE